MGRPVMYLLLKHCVVCAFGGFLLSACLRVQANRFSGFVVLAVYFFGQLLKLLLSEKNWITPDLFLTILGEGSFKN